MTSSQTTLKGKFWTVMQQSRFIKLIKTGNFKLMNLMRRNLHTIDAVREVTFSLYAV